MGWPSAPKVTCLAPQRRVAVGIDRRGSPGASLAFAPEFSSAHLGNANCVSVLCGDSSVKGNAPAARETAWLDSALQLDAFHQHHVECKLHPMMLCLGIRFFPRSGSMRDITQGRRGARCCAAPRVLLWRRRPTWLILPVVICLSQRLSHACLSISFYTAKLRMAH